MEPGRDIRYFYSYVQSLVLIHVFSFICTEAVFLGNKGIFTRILSYAPPVDFFFYLSQITLVDVCRSLSTSENL